MIQDILPHKLFNQYDYKASVAKEDTVLNICNGMLLVREEAFARNILEFPKCKDFSQDYEYTYLFRVDEEAFFLLKTELKGEEIPAGFVYVGEKKLRTEGMGPDENIFAGITGKHLADWYRDTNYCGRCGKKMVHSGKERAMTCKECGYRAYPRIMPAVIVGVKNGDRLLLTKYRTGFAHNALIAGFTEIGETVEETVQREVMEEAGLKVKNIKYYKSQPWGSANDILLGFYCEVDGDDTITMDSEELKYAEWVKREDIILQPGTFSLTNEMMRRFKEGVER